MSAPQVVLLLIITLASVAMIWVARGHAGAPGRMLHRWVVYQALLPLTVLLLLALAYKGGKLGGLLALLLIAGILVGLALFKNRNSLRSRR